MSTDVSTNPQINHDDSTNRLETDAQKIDHLADDAASKASKIQSHSEKSDTVGGVRSNSGGLFTK
ncbi:hypothetical protein [Granulicella sibirica]|uniref:Uncharacterized protein n=1 Tax=Granulicella sibirica TaxID=2479048 RepID=A0A4V1L5N1_9BACT|nr:hypothetical protein [Granulicella sibirica]RXH56344.1 hypothetical protein GRAN_3201 [Granulicella sibirica]